MRSMSIADRAIGPDQPPYVIAEISANHGQDFDRAIELIEAGAAAGADAVKFQTYRPDTITLDCDNEHFRLNTGTAWDGQTLHSLYAKAYTPWEWQPDLARRARELDVEWFSTPYDETAVEFLQDMGAPAFKVASFEIVDVPLLRTIAATGKPVIVSTGMATLDEIDEAVATLRASGCEEIALLRTNSGYPAAPDEMDLSAIALLADRFDVPVGLSDHTLTSVVPIVAVGLGASIIEKHLTLSRDLDTADRKFSLEPAEFAQMVEDVNLAYAAKGTQRFGPSPREMSSIKYRRSLFVIADIEAGEPFSKSNVRSVRPSSGLHPRNLEAVIGRVAARSIGVGTPLSWDLVEGGEHT